MSGPQQALLITGGYPPVLSGLVAWLDASDASTISIASGRISDWAAKIGSCSLTQATIGFRPTYNTPGLNGKNTVTNFAGSGCGMYSINTILRLVSGWSILEVVMTTQHSAVAYSCTVDAGGGAARASGAGITVTSGYWNCGGRRANADTFGFCTSTTVAADNTWFYTTSIGDYTNTDAYFYLNGTQIAVNNSWLTSGTTPNDNGLLYVLTNPGLANPWIGQIAEVLIYDRVITNDERLAMEFYLKSKWGL